MTILKMILEIKGVVTIKAVIMAGGKGSRLRPLTCDLPKPMVPILNKPTIEYSIELLKKYDIRDIAVTMAYMPSVIIDYFDDGSEFDVNLKYFIEETPLGTGGSVKNADDFLDETFIVISGDALTDINIKEAVAFHRRKKSKATLVLKKESIPLEYGVIITDEDGRIIRFLEKPSWGEVFSDTINTGIYILEPEVLDYFKKGDNFDFSKDLFPRLLKDGIPMYGYVTKDYWNDIGDLNTYKEAQFHFLDGQIDLEIDNKEVNTGIWIEEGTKLGDNITITPPVYIGRNCVINDDTQLGPYAVIGSNCVIDTGATVKRSVVWKNTNIGRNSHCRGTIICNNVLIKDRINALEGSSIGAGTVISNESVIKPNIKIWPDKKIGESIVVNQNLVWGTKASKTIFGNRDISGDINIDITPEFSSRLGSAFASNLQENAILVVSSDHSNSSRVIRNSLITGILSTGKGVINLKDIPMPLNRYAIKHYEADGGIHVRNDYYNENRIHIELLDENGANLDRNKERKIENLFNREDFERCNASKMKSIMDIENFFSFYIKNGTKRLDDISAIKRKNPKLLISSSCKNILDLTIQFLESIGCQVECDYSVNKYDSVDKYLKYISKQVVKNKADMGIIFSQNGENLILVDERGRIIDKEMYTVLSALILLKIGTSKRICVPYTSPKIIESMAKEYEVDVVRSKTSAAHIMNEILSNVDNENDMFLQYILNFDGILASGKIIDFLVQNSVSMGELVDELPDFYFVEKEIKCDWEDKGRVIKEILVEHKNKDIELFEGIKINNEKGWALILPDSERPVFKVYAEGFSEEYAKELSTVFSQKVEDLLGK
ncbi:sugar phosphate nucleotidyltransferase [Wukongibacter sp. M2B1]|uniref:sugar phosphate nucleotidyltransferase n=1 Tax=Wukongibacter sp. M2B1 TaxID=3088895 RepID=UPI003D7923FB